MLDDELIMNIRLIGFLIYCKFEIYNKNLNFVFVKIILNFDNLSLYV